MRSSLFVDGLFPVTPDYQFLRSESVFDQITLNLPTRIFKVIAKIIQKIIKESAGFLKGKS